MTKDKGALDMLKMVYGDNLNIKEDIVYVRGDDGETCELFNTSGQEITKGKVYGFGTVMSRKGLVYVVLTNKGQRRGPKIKKSDSWGNIRYVHNDSVEYTAEIYNRNFEYVECRPTSVRNRIGSESINIEVFGVTKTFMLFRCVLTPLEEVGISSTRAKMAGFR